MASTKPVVRAVACDWRADDEAVYRALKRATQPLTRAWARLCRARRIGIKFNQDKENHKVVTFHHHRVQLVSDCVARAVLRLLRENTAAELFCVDVSFYRHYLPHARDKDTTQLRHVLAEFGVRYLDGNADVTWVSVPGGGLMFDRYPVSSAFAEIDAWVSVQKLKNHAFTGVTLCMKNLFGLMPTEPAGRPRTYYHHLVRMPYVLADLGKLYDPALNVIDGLVGQAGEEWGPGDALRIANVLIAGDQVVATDAVGAHLMGHDPERDDWPTAPFHRDRNALRVAAENGFGTVRLADMDFISDVRPPAGDQPFFAKTTDDPARVYHWRRTTAEQALYYREHRQAMVARYAGEYVLLQMGEVKWHSPQGVLQVSRRLLSGDRPEQAMWMKYVDPAESEGEHFGVYEDVLRAIDRLAPPI